MTEKETKAYKALEDASKKYRKEGIRWSYDVAKRMLQDADDYDADVIEVLKDYVETYFDILF